MRVDETRRPFRICLLGAVERELAPLRENLEALGRDLFHWVFIATGVGKAAAAIATTQAIIEHRPQLVVQVGCAGGYPSAMPAPALSDVVLATEEVFADEGCLTPDNFLDLTDLKLPMVKGRGKEIHNIVPTWTPSPELLDNSRKSGLFGLHRGRLITVSTGSGTDARAAELSTRWQPIAESMEGAAAALACYKFACPFLEIRGISNYVGTRDRSAWTVDPACLNAATFAASLFRQQQFIDQIPHHA